MAGVLEGSLQGRRDFSDFWPHASTGEHQEPQSFSDAAQNKELVLQGPTISGISCSYKMPLCVFRLFPLIILHLSIYDGCLAGLSVFLVAELLSEGIITSFTVRSPNEISLSCGQG